MSKVFALPALPFFGSRSSSRATRSASRPAARRSSRRLRLHIVLAVAAIFLLLSYLVAVNRNASLGYQVTSLNRSISQLTQDNQKLMVRLSEANSLASPQINGTEWVNVKTAEFLAAPQHFSQR